MITYTIKNKHFEFLEGMKGECEPIYELSS